MIERKTMNVGEKGTCERASAIDEIAGTVNTTLIEGLGEKYRALGFGGNSFVKYFSVRPQIQEKMEFAVDILHLHTGKPLRVLDIGAGAGWFAYVMRYFGHDVDLTDLPEEYGISIEAYNENLAVLGFKKKWAFKVTRLTPIPYEIGKYDLITATGAAFHKYWTEQDWHFFLDDLTLKHLNHGGCVFFHINSGGTCASAYQAIINDNTYRNKEHIRGWTVIEPCVIVEAVE